MTATRMTMVGFALGFLMLGSAQAQVVVLRPGVGPVGFGPAFVAPPVARAYRVATPVPAVAYGIPTYRAGYVAPASFVPRSYATPYTSYRPVYPVAPAVVAVPAYRPAVVGPGIGGLPNVYVPGQPVRNALRFAIP